MTYAESFMTGLPEVDNLLGSTKQNSLIVLGARPGEGGGKLTYEVARRNANAGRSVLYLSAVQTEKELASRIVGKIPGSNGLSNLRFAHLPVLTPQFIEERIQQEQERHEDNTAPDLIIIQDLLRMNVRRANISDVWQPVRAKTYRVIMQELWALSDRYGVDILVLTQLARTLPRPPQLSDLRESTAIVGEADIVLLLHTGTRLIIAKNAFQEGAVPDGRGVHVHQTADGFRTESEERAAYEIWAAEQDAAKVAKRAKRTAEAKEARTVRLELVTPADVRPQAASAAQAALAEHDRQLIERVRAVLYSRSADRHQYYWIDAVLDEVLKEITA